MILLHLIFRNDNIIAVVYRYYCYILIINRKRKTIIYLCKFTYYMSIMTNAYETSRPMFSNRPRTYIIRVKKAKFFFYDVSYGFLSAPAP